MTTSLSLISLFGAKRNWLGAYFVGGRLPVNLDALEPLCDLSESLPLLIAMLGRSVDEKGARRMLGDNCKAVAKPIATMGDKWHQRLA